jgi:ribose transport system substrate-binding protein
MACAVLFVLAGCGSSSNDQTSGGSTGGSETSSNSASGGGGSPALAKVEALVEEHEAEPTEIVQAGHPLKKPPPKGMKLVYMDCGVQACTEAREGFEAVTDALGYSLKVIPSGATPSQITSAYNQAVAEKPDIVIGAGITTALFKKQLAELEANGAVFVNQQAGEPHNVSGTSGADRRGVYEAQWLAADSGCDATVQFFTIPEFPVLGLNEEAFVAELKKLCPEATVNVTKATVAEQGKQLPSLVVSSVQREPDTNYVVMGYGDMSLGVPEALKAAHLEPTVITAALSTAVLEYMKQGEITMGVAEPLQPQSWAAVDAAIRALNGEPFLPEDELGPQMVLTQENLPENVEEQYNFPKGYEQQFEELWEPKA